jgi:hypothetical protein
VRSRQQNGDLSADLDPEFLTPLFTECPIVSRVSPQLTRMIPGLDAESSEPLERLRAVERDLVTRLGPTGLEGA